MPKFNVTPDEFVDSCSLFELNWLRQALERRLTGIALNRENFGFSPEELKFMNEGKKIAAIKAVRARIMKDTGNTPGLKEVKDLVESQMISMGVAARDSDGFVRSIV